MRKSGDILWLPGLFLGGANISNGFFISSFRQITFQIEHYTNSTEVIIKIMAYFEIGKDVQK
ncbi:hypothetical protein BKK51_05805 [Rodentibacter trehalosifermentans]|uniref:Uncharacterized protein n=1 Tax=Rodentibacter trehalosifermentans TaxID=1908263 RepID=A0A1V3ITX0_9PAST|nr:hypothetical protein BKK51_05805 [Rodentibacter trehalosifermentans]OOF48604.1 hypothetical protein BKK52_05330 [Rodentibacter trehalosifermentans]OOF52531.1 hypothetical protein BKK53_04905 [Rodentibacter trehalosifermentans]